MFESNVRKGGRESSVGTSSGRRRINGGIGRAGRALGVFLKNEKKGSCPSSEAGACTTVEGDVGDVDERGSNGSGE